MRSLLSALALSLLIPVAHADRPLFTEDAEVEDRGECELESHVGRKWSEGQRSRERELELDCGVGWRSELGLSLSHSHDGAERNTLAGLQGKTRLNGDEDGNGPQLSLSWVLQRDERALLGVLSQPLAADWTLHANLGYRRSEDRGAAAWALALEHRVTSGLDLMGEVFVDDQDRNPWLQVGARWALRPSRLFVDTSWGRQTGSGARVLTLGLKLAF
ncbi:hypothetical protein [Azohydromonas caseinilytica]|uniref:Uncharacterized protein n=1 Tax=Azohydromonas caseinilytica TaxID=2728836 RepID=A0A848FJF0_9BURK|nr:hypothetical protein [Azohydromonas caseinilytica]NML19015.1 hypothetical protein [Azohydromonas caseinilytica]